MITLIEVAVYAALLAHGTPLTCSTEDTIHVKCSNGVSATLFGESGIRFSNGVTVERDDKGFPRFSDGTSSWWTAAGWLAFSDGIQIRKMNLDWFRFSTGLECRTELPALVECAAERDG